MKLFSQTVPQVPLRRISRRPSWGLGPSTSLTAKQYTDISINQPNLVFVKRRLNKVLRGASYEYIGLHKEPSLKARLELFATNIATSSENDSAAPETRCCTTSRIYTNVSMKFPGKCWECLVLLYLNDYYPAPGRGTGYCFRAISLFLCQQHYEKTAGPICMKFSGKVLSDHGRT